MEVSGLIITGGEDRRVQHSGLGVGIQQEPCLLGQLPYHPDLGALARVEMPSRLHPAEVSVAHEQHAFPTGVEDPSGHAEVSGSRGVGVRGEGVPRVSERGGELGRSTGRIEGDAIYQCGEIGLITGYWSDAGGGVAHYLP